MKTLHVTIARELWFIASIGDKALSKNAIEFRYTFEFPESTKKNLEVQLTLDPETLNHIRSITEPYPEWTKLEHHQCDHCPLDSEKDPYCPAALSLYELGLSFSDFKSYEKTRITIESQERTISKDDTVQKGLRSLMGLYMSTSGCPHLGKFKPMSRFHLGMATVEETQYRVFGMYMLAQYILKEENQDYEFSLDGLKKIYMDVHKVNKTLAERVGTYWKEDSNLNSLVLLAVLGHGVQFEIDSHVEEVKQWFKDYLKE